jgi:hypothetical protein
MTVEQQAAYWKHHARQHEDRSKAWRDAAGGKTAEELRAEREELEKLRNANRTDAEKAVADAKQAGTAEADAKWAPRLAAAEFRAALAHLAGVDERDGRDKRDRIIAGINLADYITDSGDVDTDRVQSYAADIAPQTDTGAGGKRIDYGGGRRDQTKTSGLSAGAEMFATRKKSPVS